jgi:hypothetical protein
MEKLLPPPDWPRRDTRASDSRARQEQLPVPTNCHHRDSPCEGMRRVGPLSASEPSTEFSGPASEGDRVAETEGLNCTSGRFARFLSRNAAGTLVPGASVRTVKICGETWAKASIVTEEASRSRASLTAGDLDALDLTTRIVASTAAAMSRVALTPMTGGPLRMTQS